jgi:hypothetical protein
MSSFRDFVRIALASLTLGLAGCGSGSGDGMNNTTARAPIQGLQPTLASIQDNVFTPICTACHTGGGAPQGLQLDAGVSASKLINVPVPRDTNLTRVIPGDPDHSFLINKLEGTQTIGARMPLGGPFLDPSTIAVIRQWIANGAPQ